MTAPSRRRTDVLTPRLAWRPHTISNADALIRWQTDPAADVQATLERWIVEPRDDTMQLALHLRTTDELIGFGDLGHIDRRHGRCTVRLVIGDPARRGQAYGGEALGGLLRLAFDRLGLRRIGAQVHAVNEPALKLFDRAGFKREGVLRESVLEDATPHDEVLLGLLRHEWSAV
jgi:RimJ/RimL family protein N-acetyltransferase